MTVVVRSGLKTSPIIKAYTGHLRDRHRPMGRTVSGSMAPLQSQEVPLRGGAWAAIRTAEGHYLCASRPQAKGERQRAPGSG